MKKPGFIIEMSMFLLVAACSSRPTPLPASTPTPLPTLTKTRFPAMEPEPPSPTPAFRSIDIKSGGFSLLVHPELEFDIDDHSINLSGAQNNLIISLNGRPYIASEYTMESFLDKYVTETASRGGAFIQSVPYEIMIDDMSGIAVDISGIFIDAPVAGKAFVISPKKDFIIFGLGMSNLSGNQNEWIEIGSDIFEALLASIEIKDEVKQ